MLIVFCMGLLVLAGPAYAQPHGKSWRIGFLWGGSQAASVETGSAQAFLQGMRDYGYAKGRDYVIEQRFANGKYDVLPGLAGELVSLKVDVIVTAGAAATRAVQKATGTLPVVFAVVNDPLITGFAQSLARPGGNLTGLSRSTVDISPKHVELLKTLVPKLSLLAVLVNPGNPAHPAVFKAVQGAAQTLGVKVLQVEARTPEQIERGFAAVRRAGAQGLIVGLDQFFIDNAHGIAKLALRARLPTIYSVSDDVRAGGLMSYGPPWAEFYRHSATYVVKILKGARPGDLPIEQPTRYALAINRKTAKTLKLAIPRSVLLRADEVIE